MLTKTPISTTNCVKPVLYFSAARVAFKTILENLKFSIEKKLLLPAYIGITKREGSGVFDPVIETKTPYDFYSVDKNLAAKTDELYSLITSGNYRALLIIHYFGFCQNNIVEIAKLCKKNDVILIEDCAHTMLSETMNRRLGSFGDVSFFSLHKFLPSSDGGMLVINNGSYLNTLTSVNEDLTNIKTLYILERADIQTISRIRRLNYKRLSKMISQITEIELLYPSLPEGIVPHNLPILVNNNKRELLYYKLLKRRIPIISLYYCMIEPIKEGYFDESLYISDNILNLPIHQDIDESDLKYIADSLNSSIKE